MPRNDWGYWDSILYMQFKFVYVGRLDREKGLEDIVFAFQKLLSEKHFDVHLDLFWQEGNCSAIVKELQNKYPDLVCYHGRQLKPIIRPYRQNCHFVLMPSHFLETFGLACLDAYGYWKPVIGYQEWWLKELILDDYTIFDWQDWQTDRDWLYNKITEILQLFDSKKYQQDSILCKKIFQKYSVKIWKKNIQQILSDLDCFILAPNNQGNILLISDYLYRLGGIEVFLYDSGDILEDMEYTVSYFGSQIRYSYLRKLWLLLSWWNLPMGLRLLYKLYRKSYTLLRFHSIQRFLWWFPLCVSSFFSLSKIFMLHDVGLLHPYPSYVTDESQLDFHRNIKNYLQAGYECGKTWLTSTTAMIAKYLSTSVIRCILQKSITLFLVPSEYLVPHLTRRLWNKKIYTIKILPHFVK